MWKFQFKKSSHFESRLADYRFYQSAIEDLHHKFSQRSTALMQETLPGGYNFIQAYFDRRALSKLLAKAVASGEYKFSPAERREVTIDKKRRVIHAFTLMDRIVHGAVYRMLAPDISAAISKHVYSYQSGRDKFQAISAFASYLKAHRHKYPDPRKRGLYVLRADIRGYGESIPVSPDSALWPKLFRIIEESCNERLTPQDRNLLHQLICPSVLQPDGSNAKPMRGIPDGAPVCALILNLYASPLDELLGSVRSGFYARFGDDVLFAHPDRNIFNLNVDSTSECLQTLDLEWNQSKTRQYFFNGAGRTNDEIPGASFVEYLGLRMGFDGNFTTKTLKSRKFLRDLRTQARSVSNTANHMPHNKRAKLVCDTLNKALDPCSVYSHSATALLRGRANSRSELRHLDYLIARMAVETITRSTGVRAFRSLSYRALRTQWQLTSLEYARNS